MRECLLGAPGYFHQSASPDGAVMVGSVPFAQLQLIIPCILHYIVNRGGLVSGRAGSFCSHMFDPAL